MIARILKQRRMKRRHQRRALPACRNITGAKVGNHGDTGGFRESRRIVDLPGVAFGGTMANGLAMNTDGRDFPRADPGIAQQSADRNRVAVDQRIGSDGGAVQFVLARGLQREQRGAQFRSERFIHGALDDRSAARKVGQHRIDAVEAGARHQPDAERGVGWTIAQT